MRKGGLSGGRSCAGNKMDFTEGKKLLVLFGVVCGALIAPTFCQEPTAEVSGDQVAELGSDAQFSCKITGKSSESEGLKWSFRSVLATDDTQIYISVDPDNNNPVDTTKYNVTTKDLNSNLVVKKVQFESAGIYKCGAIIDGKVSGKSNLFVIDKPVASAPDSVSDGNEATLRCDFAYAAHKDIDVTLKPTLTAKIGDMALPGNVTETPATDSDPTYKLSFIADPIMRKDHHGENFTCTVTIATSPTYEISSSKTLHINFAATPPVITPEKKVFYPGETINCTSEGFPEPTISWIPEIGNGGNIGQGSVLEITERMLGNNTWRCEAFNRHNTQKLEKRVSFEVVKGTPPDTGESKDNTVPIAVGVAVPAAVIIIIVVVVCIVCSRKKSGSAKPKGSARAEAGARSDQPRNQIYKPVSTKPEGEVRIKDEKATYKPDKEDRPTAAPRRGETVREGAAGAPSKA